MFLSRPPISLGGYNETEPGLISQSYDYQLHGLSDGS